MNRHRRLGLAAWICVLCCMGSFPERSVYCVPAGAVTVCAAQPQTEPGTELSCREGRAGCYLLQTVMMGAFEAFDPEDMLAVRVFSAVLPRLVQVTEEDFAHYEEEFSKEDDEVMEAYFRAMANCLRADLRSRQMDGETISNEERVLLLFLDPLSEADGEEQMKEIRDRMTGEIMSGIAENAHVPESFVRWLIQGVDYQ